MFGAAERRQKTSSFVAAGESLANRALSPLRGSENCWARDPRLAEPRLGLSSDAAPQLRAEP
jgi:hypothetical protein